MKTYLNELHEQCKDSHSTNYTSNLSTSNQKDEKLSTFNNNISQNQTKYKSGLFLNNFFRKASINTSKGNINNNNIKNYKKKKKINVTPYQGMKNEYILNLAMDNLNKYQEDILLKENNEDNCKEKNMNNIDYINHYEKDIDNDNNKVINYYYLNNKNKDKINKAMNKTQDNFFPNDKLYKKINNISLINYSNNEEKRNNNNNITNNYYNDFFINNDLFNNDKNIENNKYNNDCNSETYNTDKTIFKNNSYNNFNNSSNDKNIKNLNNINFEKNYENKFNIFINKSLDLKKDNSKKNNNKDKNVIDKRLIFILNNLELNELIDIFDKNFIFFDDLFLLSKDDFVEMKIPIGPRNRIINFIEQYKNFAKSYNFEELSSFMKKYKNIFINPKDNNCSNNILNANITPSTNSNKYKSIILSDNNKNKESFDSRGWDLPGKGLNMSNFEEVETISLRDEESKKNKNKCINSKNKNKSRDAIMNDINRIINNENNNNEVINNNEEENINKKNDNKINKNSKIKNVNNMNINSDNENNYYDNNNKNIFSNSLFNDFGTTINNNNEIKNNINTYKVNNLNKSCEKENINDALSAKPSKTKDLNSFNDNNDINKYSSPSLNFINNKLNYKSQNVYKNFQNIFSEIENYQINYEKMKKQNDTRNNKINNLLERKNRANIHYLKMKLKNSKYYNEEDLKNESLRDLKAQLKKMNFQKENDNNQLNSIKYNPSIQNYLKKKNNKNNNNPLIEEFNKHK